MDQRKHYFVKITEKEINEVSIPDRSAEYEIVANNEEVEEIRELFLHENKNAKNSVEYLSKPFDEWGADDERNSYDDHLITVYRKVYKLGTDKTKEKIGELGIL
ncbi:hypothetical protein [Oceanobacillus manasiensis]|uniref:hypothetical protein n=1 Tax=Oceanobacillus manasiensis TaxID=586413 RepID=UPI0005A7FE04|nr:hypothetical protein [Oceanobacillus manasiensis]